MRGSNFWLYIFQLLMLVLISCDWRSIQSEDDFKQIELVTSKDQNKLDISIQDILEVDLGDQEVLSSNLRMRIISGDFYIFDKDYQKLICVDSSGKFKFRIGQLGRGPNELQHAVDFSVYGNEVSFLIQASDIAYIATFNQSDSLISSHRIEYPVSSFVQVSQNEYFVYTGWNGVDVPFRLARLNFETNENIEFFNHKHLGVKVSLESYSMYNDESGVYFFDPLTPNIYSINKSLDVSVFAKLKLDNYGLSEDYWNLDRDEAMVELFRNGFYSCNYFFKHEGKLLLLGDFVNSGGENQEITFSLVNLNESSIYSYVLRQDTKDELLINAFGFEGDNLYSFADGYVFKSIQNKNSELGKFNVSENKYYVIHSKLQ